MKKILMATLCTSMIIFGANYALADTATAKNDAPPPPPKEHKMKQPPHQKLAERLNLTEEQKTIVKEQHKKSFEKMKPLMDEMRVKRQAIREIKENSTLSEKDKNKQIATIRKDMKVLKVKADKIREANMKEFEAILTVEQKAEFEKIKKDIKKHKPCKGHHAFPTPPPNDIQK